MKKLFLSVCFLVLCMMSALGSPQSVNATDSGPLRAACIFQMVNNVITCSVAPAIPKHKRSGQWYVTESGYLAAVEEILLDRAIFWAGMGDEEEFMRFIASTDLVFPLKGGLRVYVEKFSFSGKVRIRPEGSDISVWTIREAIRSEFSMEGT